MATFMRTKSIEDSIRDTQAPEHSLKKNLSWIDLTIFGIGVVIGAGIFTFTGKVAHGFTGPSIVISFIIAAIVCGLAALCYAEFASTVPVAGSAYTFSYASLGEFIAWIIGWDLLLELLLGAGVVAQGWSQYADSLLQQMGITIPRAIAPHTAENASHVNILALLLVGILTLLVAWGIRESMRVNMVLVALKLGVVIFVIVAGLFYVNANNYTPFIPPAQPGEAVEGIQQPLIQALLGFTPTTFGFAGIITAASLVFFAYIGFDVVATTAEETRNPKRDLPIGILLSLVICTILYVAVSAVITGMVPYDKIDPSAALASAFRDVGHSGYAAIISAGAVAGLTTVVMTLMIGAVRVCFAMSRDHLLPPSLSMTNQRTGTPIALTFIIGGLAALISGFVTVDLEAMVNIGTLFAFTLVAVAVPVLRRRRPDLPRAFRVPFSPVLPAISALASVYLMLNLPIETWIRFIGWMALGTVIYIAYGYRRSRLATGKPAGQQ